MVKRNTMKSDLHGLAMFISDIRNSKGKDAETKRVNKELAKIRCKFGSNALLDGYSKKKYVCKLVYIFLLGYDFDFGQIVAINLLNSSKYSEKYIGYMFVSVVMSEKSNLMLLVLKAIENELTQSVNPVHQNLALKYAANMAHIGMVDALSEPVLRLLFASDTPDAVKQSAVLCLLRLFRLKPDVIPEKDLDNITNFLTCTHLGVVTAAVSLIEELAISDKLNVETCVSFTISKLKKVLKSNCKDQQEYSYYYVPAPWLTVKLLRLLRHFPFPTNLVLKSCLVESIEMIFIRVQEPPKTKKAEHRNCKNALMFEAISLVHHMNMETYLQINACNILEMCLKQHEPNIRYLVLENMSILSGSEVCRMRMKEQLKTVMNFLQSEKDVCIRRKLTDLLYNLCDQSNVKQVLEEMLYCMETEDISLREEIVLKISILAEKFFQNRTEYIDVIFNILKGAGEYVPEAVWHRLIQVVTNEEAVQSYAAKAAFEALENSRCHEKLVSLAGFILGEFGNLIAGDTKCSPYDQLRLVHSNFHLSSNNTKAILLTTYMKFANLYQNIQREIKIIFKNFTHSCDPEVQQRAVEYLKLCEVGKREVLIGVLEKMPRVRKETCVEDTLQRMKSGTTDINPQRSSKISRSISLCRNFSNQYKVTEEKLTEKYAAPLRSLTMPQQINASLTDHNISVDAFSRCAKETNFSQNTTTIYLTSNQESLKFLIWHENGIIYESNILLLHVDTKFQKYKGHVHLKYTNKTSEMFNNFKPFFPVENFDKLKLDVQPCAAILQPYETIEQEVGVECMRDFDHRSSLSLNFILLNFPATIHLFLPLTMNKFIEPVTMTSEVFCRRWNFLKDYHENVKTFPAKYIMERGLVANKLKGFGLMLLQGIDPSKENFVGAGIFHSKFLQVGMLLRLESDYVECAYRLTIRSTMSTVSEEISKLLEFLL